MNDSLQLPTFMDSQKDMNMIRHNDKSMDRDSLAVEMKHPIFHYLCVGMIPQEAGAMSCVHPIIHSV